VDERNEVMSAGYVLGAEPQPILSFSARVGGPLASTTAEAASMPVFQLLRDVRHWYSNRVHLLIFVDCLVVLDIIRKWGRSDFHPSPKEAVHFAVFYPLLQELRRWIGKVTLVKVKSHTGCLLNERADELAELGRQLETLEICPGPQKYGSFWLRIRPAVRKYAEKCSKSLPRDSAPIRSLLDAVVAFKTLRAVKKHSTMYVTDLLHRKEEAVISRIQVI
jgi:ribonuclease HI